MRSEIIKPVKKVRGGVSVSHEKHTKDMQVKRIPAPETVTLPMSQHIGAPCTPTVKVGDRVLVGQVVGDTDKYVSAPVHASVSGKVTAVKEIRTAQGIVSQAVIIENDGLMEEAEFTPPKVETHDDLIKAVRASGAVGLGGAGFPTHVKLNFPQDGSVDTLIINAAECEPYITVDYRECLDNSWDVMSGVHLLKDMLNFKKVIIAVEDNKPDAIKILERIAEKDDPDDVIKVMPLRSKYPQGAERCLIYAVTDREINSSMLPADAGCVVDNVDTVCAVYRAVMFGRQVTEKIVTVTGDGIANPQNFRVKIGTSFADLIEAAGGLNEPVEKVISGGPMMGFAMYDYHVPIVKTSSAILCLKKDEVTAVEATACINCGRCVSACPARLVPSRLATYSEHGQEEQFVKHNGLECVECGCCSFVCPAKRHLTQSVRSMRKMVLANRKKAK